MRVIAGEFGRRTLVAPKGDTTRPTPDRLRESLFSILAPVLAGTDFVDLYCGSGAVGIEALSRGAAHCLFVEKDRAALEALRENLATLKIGARAEVVAKPVGSVLQQRAIKGIVFIDPPYGAVHDYENALEWISASSADIVLFQHDRRLKLPEAKGNLKFYRQLKQGDNCISFYHFVDGA